VLAQRLRMLDSFVLAQIVGTQATVAYVIPDRHAPAAAAAEDQSLQQGRSFAGRALAPVTSHGLRALVKTLLILLEIFPG
jgi:hypothetical protein